MNSISARLTHVVKWLQNQKPDVLLLQELKGLIFPSETFREIGYESAAVTQKSYNGVAILSRHPIEVVKESLEGSETDSHARFLEAKIQGIRVVNIYAPNGNPIGSERFIYKLDWMDRLLIKLVEWKTGEPTLIGGDFNVIPEDIDCHKPSSWMGDALFQPELRTRYRAWLELGYTDAFRKLHPGETGQFTFWDYFRNAFQNGRGIRIDHFLLNPASAKRLQSCVIDREPRAWERPSDHAPIIVELAS